MWATTPDSLDASGDRAHGPGDDMSGIAHNDVPFDLGITDYPPYYICDFVLGGSYEVTGASKWVGGLYTFELRKSLNSGDAAGNDVALVPGDTVLAVFFFGRIQEGSQKPTHC